MFCVYSGRKNNPWEPKATVCELVKDQTFDETVAAAMRPWEKDPGKSCSDAGPTETEIVC